jgi:hypothetical protein
MRVGATRPIISAKVQVPLPKVCNIVGATSAVTRLHIRLYVTIEGTFAPSIPPITTAAIAIGAITHIIAPWPTVVPRSGVTI